MFAIVPRETFCCQLLLFSCSAGLFAVLLAFLPFCWSMPVCWLFCRSAGFSAALLACCWRFGLPGDSRLPVFLSACALMFFCCWSHCRLADLCRLHLPCLPVFSVAQFSVFVVHVDILMFVIV
ncbi:hypothetical protein [Thiolapillus sp.]|uniref:hypothetical protein n=1 Tax=Thiolapillus sp. TaxID=2017437 RepID=UPI003AF89F8B